MAWFTRGYCFPEGFFVRRENHFPFPVRLDVKPWPSKRRIVSDFGFASGLASRSSPLDDIEGKGCLCFTLSGSSKDIKFLYPLLSRLSLSNLILSFSILTAICAWEDFQCDLYLSNGWAQPTPKFVCITAVASNGCHF